MYLGTSRKWLYWHYNAKNKNFLRKQIFYKKNQPTTG